MRIFIGIPISEDLRLKILEWRKHIDLSLSPSPSPGEGNLIRWIAGKNLHITLVPPWYEEDIEAVSSKLKAVSCEPFDLSFDRITFGPNLREPRLIWATGKAPGELISLKTKIEKILTTSTSPQPSPISERGFKMHLTLARFRPMQNAEFRMQNKAVYQVDWKMIADRFVLYESHLSPAGADYEILAEFPLGL